MADDPKKSQNTSDRVLEAVKEYLKRTPPPRVTFVGSLWMSRETKTAG